MEPDRVYMSRRREAQDLARALALSTQEALAIAELPPHTLSSKTTTQDSREMELKAVIDPRLDLSSRDGTSGSGSGPSAIDSFTPQLPIRPSSILLSSSNSFPTPAQQSRSSPILPIPSSRLSTTEKTRSSGSSSHRPLFSPTQTSKDRPGSGPTPRTRTPPRASHRADMTRQKANRRILLSSSPPEAAHAGKHPSSDHEEQEEVEERPVSRLPSDKSTKAVGPSRLGPKPFPMSPPPKRHVSPDPLEANLSGPISPTTVLVEESIVPIDPPRMRAQSSVPVESQISMAESASTRRSSRVVENEAKKEREKEEKRAKRRAEKEAKARKEAEAQNREENNARREKGVQSPMKGRRSTRLEVEVSLQDRRRSTRTAPESIVALEYTPTRPRRDSLSTPQIPGPPPVVDPKAQPDRRSKRARDPENTLILDGPADATMVPAEAATKLADGVVEAAASAKGVAKKAKKDHKRAKKIVKKAPEEVAPAAVVERTSPSGIEAEKSVEEKELTETPAKEVEVESELTSGAIGTRGETSAKGEVQVAEADAVEDEIGEVDEKEPVIPPPNAPAIHSPLRTHATNIRHAPAESSSRASPGPSSSGIKWKTSRNDLNSVLSKFPGARQTGMSRKLKIAPLHMKIGPPVKALPPPPPKPSRKKKAESDDEDEEEAEMESDGEGGTRKKPKVKGIEWFMEED